jgi:hypothetical protein
MRSRRPFHAAAFSFQVELPAERACAGTTMNNGDQWSHCLTGRGLTYLLLTLAAFTATAAGAVEKSAVKADFPRLGGYQIGANPYPDSYADPAYHRDLAKLDLVILGGGVRQMTKFAKAIKAISPDTLVGKYTNVAAVFPNSSYGKVLAEKLASEQGPNTTNARDWFLRDWDGNIVTGATDGTQRANITEWVRPDANGLRWPDFRARFDYDYWFEDPVWDVWFSDVVNWQPKYQNRGDLGDFSGSQDTPTTEVNTAWRRGHQRHWNAIRRLRPDVMILANLNWYLYQDAYDKWDLVEYDRQVEGALLELVMRPDGGIEKNKGWHKLYDYYRWTMSYLTEPKLVMFNVGGNPGDYRWFRYTFATCLMGDAFFDYSPQSKYQYGTVEWFDEFDRAGQDRTNWMGRPSEGMPTAAWKNGVWRRDFQNAVVLVNPRGNGPRTVTVESGLRRLEGKQAPAVNNGEPASSISLADGDGIVLVKASYLSGTPRPRSPGLTIEP